MHKPRNLLRPSVLVCLTFACLFASLPEVPRVATGIGGSAAAPRGPRALRHPEHRRPTHRREQIQDQQMSLSDKDGGMKLPRVSRAGLESGARARSYKEICDGLGLDTNEARLRKSMQHLDSYYDQPRKVVTTSMIKAFRNLIDDAGDEVALTELLRTVPLTMRGKRRSLKDWLEHFAPDPDASPNRLCVGAQAFVDTYMPKVIAVGCPTQQTKAHFTMVFRRRTDDDPEPAPLEWLQAAPSAAAPSAAAKQQQLYKQYWRQAGSQVYFPSLCEELFH